jgi:hypothetical protein
MFHQSDVDGGPGELFTFGVAPRKYAMCIALREALSSLLVANAWMSVLRCLDCGGSLTGWCPRTANQVDLLLVD